jgi:hypothetical protein
MRLKMTKDGRGPEDSQKAKHGGNRAGDHTKSSGGAGKSSQAAGKDPHRGKS